MSDHEGKKFIFLFWFEIIIAQFVGLNPSRNLRLKEPLLLLMGAPTAGLTRQVSLICVTKRHFICVVSQS